MRRWLFGAVLALFLACIFSLAAGAESGNGEVLADAYSRLAELIPEDVADLLPDGFFSEDIDEVHDAVKEVSGFGWIMKHAARLLGADLEGALRLFAHLLAVLLMAALFAALKGIVGSEALSKAVSLCGSLAVAGCLLSLVAGSVETVSAFLTHLCALANGMIPVIGVLLAMGGNVGTAVVANGGMMLFLELVENLCVATLPAVVGICVAVAVAGCFWGGANLRGIGNFIKRIYTFFLSFIMLLLTFSLSVQTSLSAGADSVAMKSARMLAGRAIPVVGGSVGETLRTVAASVSYLRSTAGVAAVIVVALLLLPTVITVIVYRLGLIAASACADLLGCSAEGKLLEAFVTVYGYMLAVICICSVVFVLLLTLFVKCNVAIA